MNLSPAPSSSSSSSPARLSVWAGRILTALPALALLGSAAGKLSRAAGVVEMFVDKMGFSPSHVPLIGAIELTCVLLYLVPPTAVLGAILLTGYLGGAVLTHLRFEGTFALPAVLLGAMAWGGLYFRDERVRALLPLRRG